MSMLTRLFVGNLPDNYNEKSLRKEFSSYGQIANLDVKSKPSAENDKKIFAFVTLSANNYDVESCIKHFTSVDFCGNRLYVTRARESFLERLERERQQAHKPKEEVHENLNVQKNPLGDTFNLHKTKFKNNIIEKTKSQKNYNNLNLNDSMHPDGNRKRQLIEPHDATKSQSDEKRLESIKRKRQEFNEKKRIIKTGLASIDKHRNKKIFFSDNDESHVTHDCTLNESKSLKITKQKVKLFNEDESDDETNFEIKKQFEGKHGQKILELQSKYKSDKRFTLEERFAEEDKSDDEVKKAEDEDIDLGQADEKSKQLNILQDVLGVSITNKHSESKNKNKPKTGMLRFDPTQPDHAKYLAPVKIVQDTKKSKKNKLNKGQPEEEILESTEFTTDTEKVVVLKEQFYKISDTFKETISQPNEFSLRSLFAVNETNVEETSKENEDYIPLETKKEKKVKNPLDPNEKNPFVYDSSDTENEEEYISKPDVSVSVPENIEPKIVWREKLFFTESDQRLKDGLLFFSQENNRDGQKNRRELKAIMKKRISNKDRKNTMFRKKIGGRKKPMKNNFRKKR